MKYTVLTLFPEITDAFFANSIMAKAIKKGIIEYQAVNIRDFTTDKHKTCDDAPYGGGPGMLMLPEPLAGALEAVGVSIKPHAAKGKRVVYLSPSGKPFTQELARELAGEQELILICGRYEGIDQRIIDRYTDDEISVGDYVLSSGEVAALTVIDATYRLVDSVICADSLSEESFSDGLLEYPQFTRPEVFDTMRVPEVLLSGHHEQIRLWRLEKRVEKTLLQRPDLIQRGRELGIFNKEINSIIDRLTFLTKRGGEIQGEDDERNSGN
ncbi:MAG: tRNA (guanosine(37)-N1)-methyltransferase TrmD [Treponema sp.]|nr:tRNA (guanosine(37)-N1)-methyltransferase TrmD [Treponema sp.]MCL2252139.1 tRNA (guanosine(37)-N1)-methyltransferase TrmD [Treponema sp.]